jgi:WD domain, G-beta repeat
VPVSGAITGRLTGHRDLVLAPSASADGRVVVAAGWDGTARLWDTRTRRALGAPIAFSSPDGAAAVSPDGSTVAISEVAPSRGLFSFLRRFVGAAMGIKRGSTSARVGTSLRSIVALGGVKRRPHDSGHLYVKHGAYHGYRQPVHALPKGTSPLRCVS